MKTVLCLLLKLLATLAAAQSISGIVVDEVNNPVLAANVFLKSQIELGTVTNFDGQFQLDLNPELRRDTLCFSYLGFERKEIAVATLLQLDSVVVILEQSPEMLSVVTITAEDPISEQFAAIKLEQLEIYLNPVAAADPLRAITTLPASTNLDETANPSLRGSDADRSRVMFNGVPVYRPVRNSQINGIGNFSLFNTALIHKQYVYASNPPLTYGNTSAGLVEIETIRELPYEQIQLSTSLANMGIFLAKELGNKAFVQGYGNYQFSDAFLGINKNSFPNLKHFGSKDAGFNFRYNINEDWSINWFSYAIDENYQVLTNAFNYQGEASGAQRRNFNIFNLKKSFERGFLSLNHGNNFSKSRYAFGNITSTSTNQQFYTALNYKHFASRKLTYQLGVTHDYSHFDFQNTNPNLFYDLRPTSESTHTSAQPDNHNIEVYAYGTWDIGPTIQLSSGLRKNWPIGKKQVNYFSYQAGLKFQPDKKHNLLLSGGKYHNYNTPNYYLQEFALLNSTQIALDYSYSRDPLQLSLAAYIKKEAGNQISNAFFTIQERNLIGFEAAIEKELNEYFKINLSYTYLDVEESFFESNYRGENDLNYFLKAMLEFNHPELFSAAISYQGRPGKYFTPIVAGQWMATQELFQPIFDNEFNSTQFGNYHNLSFSVNRYFRKDKTGIIAFLSVNNLLNTKNQQSPIYLEDYSTYTFNYYQQRSIYFGLVWQWNN